MAVVDTYTIFGSWPQGGADLSLDRLKTALQGKGVAQAIAHSTDCVFESTDDTHKALLERLSGEPALKPAAVVDPTFFVKPWEFAAKIAAQPFACVRFFPEVHHWPIGDYLPFVKCLEALQPSGVPISIAITTPGQITALSRLPGASDLPILLVHVADDCVSEIASVVPSMSGWAVSTDGFVHLGLLEELADAIGSERLIFGSSAPRGSLEGSLRYITQSQLPDGAKQSILSDNAARFFGGRLGSH